MSPECLRTENFETLHNVEITTFLIAFIMHKYSSTFQ